jgi:type I restriction enzyme, S subunit
LAARLSSSGELRGPALCRDEDASDVVGPLREVPSTDPPLPEQRKIAEILSGVDEAIAAARRVIKQTERVKQGLLQTLMTRGIGHARFKQTEIEEIPEAWEIADLGDVSSLQTGPFGSQLKASAYTAQGIPVAMPSNLERGRIDADGIARVPDSVAQRLAKHRLAEGDVVFARRGEIGRSALVTDDEAGWLCGTGCLRARPSSEYDPRFLLLAASRHWSRQWLQANALGQTMLNLNTSILSALPLPLPPLAEQRKIVEMVEAVSVMDAHNRKSMATLQTLKRGLMQDLLTGRVRVQPD